MGFTKKNKQLGFLECNDKQQILKPETILPPVSYSLCGFSPVHGDYIAVFDVYMDESGTHDEKHLVVAGYVSQIERWAVFAQEWKRVLDKYAIPYFHMRELRSPQARAYRHLTDRDREELLGALIKVIHHHVFFGVAFASNPGLYKKLTTPVYRSRHGSCYSFSIQGCLAQAFYLLAKGDYREGTLGVFVEEGHKNSREVIEAIREFKKDTDPIEFSDDLDGVGYGGPLEINKDWHSGEEDPLRRKGIKIGAYGLGPKKGMLPLQAADLFAYCAYGLGQRKSADFCLETLKRLNNGVPHYGLVGNKEMIMGVIQRAQSDTEMMARQRQAYYTLGKQLRARGFEVEKIEEGLSVWGTESMFADFYKLSGMRVARESS